MTASQDGTARAGFPAASLTRAGKTVSLFNNDDSGVMDNDQQIATDNRAKSSSTSWGLWEALVTPSNFPAENDAVMQMAAQGRTIFAAAGDSGGDDPYGLCPPSGLPPVDPQDPATQPYRCAVGGTEITVANPGQYTPSAFGFSDPGSGVFYSSTVGGTRCAAPRWAGFAAIVAYSRNQKRAALGKAPVGQINPALCRLGPGGAPSGRSWGDSVFRRPATGSAPSVPVPTSPSPELPPAIAWPQAVRSIPAWIFLPDPCELDG